MASRDTPKRPASPGRRPASPRGQGRVGELIAGRYRIESRIASGGFGSVYTGQHIHMGHRVAIKILHPKAENLPGLVERFRREAIVGAHVRHPNIASAIDYGTLEDGSYYLVLEHVDGETVKKLLKRGAFALPRAISVTKQLASALAAAHSMGIVHRDLKPANVMLVAAAKGGEAAETVKLIDFGFAKIDPSQHSAVDLPAPVAALQGAGLTVDGMLFGTVAYMAPEVFHGMDKVDARSDLYALGLLAYEMATGQRPFQGRSDAELFKQKLEGSPPPLATHGLDEPLASALDAVIQRLMACKPADRYATADEVFGALQSLEGAPAGAAPTSPTLPEPKDDVPADGPEHLASDSSDGPASDETEDPAPGALEAAADSGADQPSSSEVKRSALAVVEQGGGPLAADATARRGSHGALWALLGLGVAGLGAAGLAHYVWRGASVAPRLPTAVEPSASSSSAPVASASGAPVDDVPAVEPPEAQVWRRRLSAAERARDWKKAYRAFTELAKLYPPAFREPLLRSAAANTLAALTEARLPEADAMIRALESDLGPAGPDVLFHVVQFRGGTRARERAAATLAKPEVRQRAGPALNIALELRRLGCKAPADLLRQTVSTGDERALMVLNVQRSTCAPSHERNSAFRLLEARLSDHVAPASEEVVIIDSVPDGGGAAPSVSAAPLRSAAPTPAPARSAPPLEPPGELDDL
jgi:serine/threonine-protein kinase